MVYPAFNILRSIWWPELVSPWLVLIGSCTRSVSTILIIKFWLQLLSGPNKPFRNFQYFFPLYIKPNTELTSVADKNFNWHGFRWLHALNWGAKKSWTTKYPNQENPRKLLRKRMTTRFSDQASTWNILRWLLRTTKVYCNTSSSLWTLSKHLLHSISEGM